ncbi:methylmalonic aciduria and homocystinuria type D protein [Microcoleus sp. FACHB-68]|uniref:methylmalonic aciduria and homocystinuria type D protein n=1 Tax=Microcoleus sp. FACHB-68 TaxID=2692826 RepID=UPI0016873106|nr:methylmalonic aciduria and homocystinuria type D protein [Microcoleus sp. FACHB-68]MBD1939473.1 methylmalonic aciduria and homocystinuria type D protein [Microcoleus sp. FACHB-68]
MVYARQLAGNEALSAEQPTLKASQQQSPIERVTQTGQAVEMSVHRCSPFVAQNLERVFPDWVLPVTTCRVIVVLQQSRYPLAETAPHIEREKDRLRERFISFGSDVVRHLRARGFLTDLIDPRTGYPLLSRPGEIAHDDTAAVKALLGFPVIHNRCSVLEHPSWGSGIYPSILITSASSRAIMSVLKRVALQHDWIVPQPKAELKLSLLEI